MRVFTYDESGQGLVEYALIIALVALVAFVALQTLGKRVNSGIGKAEAGFS